MLTTRTKYALKAMRALAAEAEAGARPLRIEEIAARSGAPKKFLEHILLDLKRAGFVGSRRGRNGGYTMIKPARAVSLAEILRLIDGPLAPLPCLSRRAYQRCADCDDETDCSVRALFAEFYAAQLLLIESLTVADLLRDAATLARVTGPAPAAQNG